MSTQDQSVFLEGDESAKVEGAPIASTVTLAAEPVEADRAPFATGELRAIQVPSSPSAAPAGPPVDDDRPIPLMIMVLGAAVLVVILFAAYQARGGGDDASAGSTVPDESSSPAGRLGSDAETDAETDTDGDGEIASAATDTTAAATAPTLAGADTPATDADSSSDAGASADPAAPTTATGSPGSSTTLPPSTSPPPNVAPTTTAAPTTTVAPTTTAAAPTTTRAELGQQLRALPPDDDELEEGDPVDLFVIAVGGRPGPVTFSAQGLPPGLTIDPTTGRVTGTPIGEGVYTVSVTVSQDGAAFTQGFTWEVDD